MPVDMAGSNYPPDWQKRRISIFQRDEWTCQKCDYEHSADSDKQLHAHHVTPISEGGGHSLDNLLTLCGECHMAVHTNGITPPVPDSYDCAYCGHPVREDLMYAGSYCSEVCWSRHQAEKRLSDLRNDATICSTCFSKFPRGDSVCPRCGNWDPNVDRSDDIDDVDVNVSNLATQLILRNDA